MSRTADTAAEKKPKKPPVKFVLKGSGAPLAFKGVDKFYRDVIGDHNGVRRFVDKEIIEVADPALPLNPRPLQPGPTSPICAKCGMDEMGARHPYFDYAGAKNPVATILVECVSAHDDWRGRLGAPKSLIATLSAKIAETIREHGVKQEEIRFVPITRCACREGKPPNYKTKGNWCRHFAIQDLMLHPPLVVIPVGTSVLGLLSYKSSAEDWAGRVLTWRGWPDDWLMNEDFMLDRPDPLYPEKQIQGHPLFGPMPATRIPMVPIQNPHKVGSFRNDKLNRRWKRSLIKALQTGRDRMPAPRYHRPWYNLTSDPEEILATLARLLRYAQEIEGFIIAYDTETTGLKPWSYFQYLHVDGDEVREEPKSAVQISPPPRIVTIMLRWTNPETEKAETIGFPWEHPEPLSPELKPEVPPLPPEARERITPLLLQILRAAQIVGHNLTFDALFTIATIGCQPTEYEPFTIDGNWNPAWLALQSKINRLCDAAVWDTWHMAFTLLQRRGSLGLEILTYDYVEDLAGYEEEMTLLIGLHDKLLNPASGFGGHYAACPARYWDSHYQSYVMGDVETTYQIRDALAEELANFKPFQIPLADPHRPGEFCPYSTPDRNWVYRNIVSPASRALMKMMARGMYVDPAELERQEQNYPHMIEQAKQDLKKIDPIIERWCQTRLDESERARLENPSGKLPLWELDLENRTQLKDLLFHQLKLKVQRLTKEGRKKYGENESDWMRNAITEEDRLAFAAVDKYTLNKLAAEVKTLGPLQEYRKLFKLYSTYVRPMRNMLAEGIDKKLRNKEPNLSIDHCIHASFLITGTRGGRLSSRDPNLQNLPNDGLVKKLFTSRFGERGCVYTVDLSQIELRLMAAACGDKSMVEAYHQNVDLHSLTASKIKWSDGKHEYEEFTKENLEKLQRTGQADKAKKLELRRRIGKTANFLTGYGGGAFGLQNVLASNQIYMDIEECEDVINSFFDGYPTLKRFLGLYKAFIEDYGKAVSLFGRVRQFDEMWSTDPEARSKALRAGANHLIQSTAADMMLLCLIAVEAEMRDAGLNSLLVSTVHDSLVIDAVRSELPQVHAIADMIVNHIPEVITALLPDYDTSWMILPFCGDSEVGLNYLHTNKIGRNPDWDELLAPRQVKA
jgi:DNA polymerase I-like protein with 3'-5' exonuclease and polymerase domains